MMSYSEWAQQVGEQWVAALKRAEDAAATVSENVQSAAGRLPLPAVQVPANLTRFGDTVADKLPNPSDIIEVNFALTVRLLEAQRELALKLIELGPAGATAKPDAVNRSD
jgi:hypothetical protein